MSLARPCRRLASAVAVAMALAACSGEPLADPAAERGRQVYQAQCTACHAADPSRDGPVGPSVKGSSLGLLEARVLRGAYPDGYRPKRSSRVMQPIPTLEPALPDLAAYLH